MASRAKQEWFVEYNDRKNKSAQFLSDADAIAGSKAMAIGQTCRLTQPTPRSGIRS